MRPKGLVIFLCLLSLIFFKEEKQWDKAAKSIN